MAFVSAVLTALIEIVLIVAVIVVAIKVGSTLRKRKDAKKAEQIEAKEKAN